MRNSTGWGWVSGLIVSVLEGRDAYQDFVFACVVGRVFEVHSHQVAGELAVGGFFYAVEHEVHQVESTQ